MKKIISIVLTLVLCISIIYVPKVETQAASIEEQLQRLGAAIRKSVPFVNISGLASTTIGLISSHNDVWVQHLLPINKVSLPGFTYMGLEERGREIIINYGGNNRVISLVKERAGFSIACYDMKNMMILK